MEMDYNVIRKEINDALAAIGQKHGFDAKIAGITFDNTGFRTSIHALVTETVTGKSGAQAEYEKYAPKFGIDPRTYGKTFKDNKGDTLTVVGINPRARTMPVIARDVFGKEYKCSAAMAGVLKVVPIKNIQVVNPDWEE